MPFAGSTGDESFLDSGRQEDEARIVVVPNLVCNETTPYVESRLVAW